MGRRWKMRINRLRPMQKGRSHFHGCHCSLRLSDKKVEGKVKLFINKETGLKSRKSSLFNTEDFLFHQSENFKLSSKSLCLSSFQPTPTWKIQTKTMSIKRLNLNPTHNLCTHTPIFPGKKEANFSVGELPALHQIYEKEFRFLGHSLTFQENRIRKTHTKTTHSYSHENQRKMRSLSSEIIPKNLTRLKNNTYSDSVQTPIIFPVKKINFPA